MPDSATSYDYKDSLEKLKTELKLKGSSELTVKNYHWFVNRFLQNSSKAIEELTEDDVKKFLAGMMDSKSRSTLSLAASSLKYFFSEIINKPLTGIRLPRKDKKLPSVLSKEEVRSLIESATNRKSRLIVKMLYSSGLRVSELVNLKCRDINLNEKLGWVRAGKGGKDRFFVIAELLIPELETRLKESENEYLFSSDKEHLTPRNIQKIIKNLAKKANINKKVTPHTMRHTYATHLLEAGVDIRKIQTILGHENLSTTQIYTHVSAEEIRKIRNPLDELNPPL